MVGEEEVKGRGWGGGGTFSLDVQKLAILAIFIADL